MSRCKTPWHQVENLHTTGWGVHASTMNINIRYKIYHWQVMKYTKCWLFSSHNTSFGCQFLPICYMATWVPMGSQPPSSLNQQLSTRFPWLLLSGVWLFLSLGDSITLSLVPFLIYQGANFLQLKELLLSVKLQQFSLRHMYVKAILRFLQKILLNKEFITVVLPI